MAQGMKDELCANTDAHSSRLQRFASVLITLQTFHTDSLNISRTLGGVVMAGKYSCVTGCTHLLNMFTLTWGMYTRSLCM